MTTATFHQTRLVSSPLYQRRLAATSKTQAEVRLRAAYYTDPQGETVWPALFPYLHEAHDGDPRV